ENPAGTSLSGIFLFKESIVSKDSVGPKQPGSFFVILNAVKNLVLYPDVSPFFKLMIVLNKGLIWVLRDEILHCVQNDKVSFGCSFPLPVPMPESSTTSYT
ncbi:MAG: hypothetical protein M3328_18725, partial [Chloroflexota bacterium]|nr:hypothetical protein [Chloroflexota bacterium]